MSAIYHSRVMHRRLFPLQYRFAYRIFSLLLDIDRLDEDLASVRWLSRNRFNLLSFYDRDHGPRDGSSLRDWLEGHLRVQGIDLQGGRVQLLCMPRVLGWGFNPLSLWYCEGSDGQLRAILCEVHNTFGEAHSYLLHNHGQPMTWPVRQSRDKCFHVSPFIDMQATYHFRLSPPQERLQIGIVETQQDKTMLVAAQNGERLALNNRNLLRLFFAIPLVSFKVIFFIHYQALKIWLGGGRFYSKPNPPEQEVS